MQFMLFLFAFIFGRWMLSLLVVMAPGHPAWRGMPVVCRTAVADHYSESVLPYVEYPIAYRGIDEPVVVHDGESVLNIHVLPGGHVTVDGSPPFPVESLDKRLESAATSPRVIIALSASTETSYGEMTRAISEVQMFRDAVDPPYTMPFRRIEFGQTVPLAPASITENGS